MDEALAVQFGNLTKRFPGSVALDGVTLTVKAGSCHGLVGENGAGKSTLGKVLAGIHQPDAGEMIVFSQRRSFRSPAEALDAGIAIVHQELSFCENMTVGENLLLGRLPRSGPFLSRRQMWAEARKLLADIAPEVDVTWQLGKLPVSQQQLVQIAAAIGRGARLIIFDEPTSSLSEPEAQRLHALIRQLLAHGVTCLYISHRLPEIFSLCDTISVLRDGKLVHSGPRSGLDENRIIGLMIGRQLAEYFPRHIEQQSREVLLDVEGLTSPGRFTDVHLTVRAGEIVGLAGLVGAGRTEVAEAIFGLDPKARGTVRLLGREPRRGHTAETIAAGLGLVPEDRKRHGLVPGMSVADNLALPIMGRLAKLGWLNRRELQALTERYLRRLRVRASGPAAMVSALSGGNQQKVMLSRWLAAECRVLILDEPTRGVDVGAKAEIHALIDELAAQGMGVLLISSELPELLHLSTRLLVMHDGRLVAELARDEMGQERVLRLMGGWAT
ncbi:MAG: sugar ABC transporter ATP-binding protein [Armatimonadia bacterium]